MQPHGFGPPRLRLLADDLTGALDSAAELAGLCGPVPVAWQEAAEGSLALDSGTREAGRDAAFARVRALAPALAGGDIACKKLDSLWRGQPAAELAACLSTGAWAHCVLAPAFPAQRRITRGGRVLFGRPDGGWETAPVDPAAALAAEGLAVRPGRPEAPLPPGISLFDAETEEDLARIVALGRAAPGPVLWCGSGGLARALAGDAVLAPETRLDPPVLGLFGSDHAVTARQLAACGTAWLRLPDGAGAAPVARRLDATGLALVSLDLPRGLDRGAAARRIAAGFAVLARALPRPGTLIVAGGETLRALCDGLGAHGLLAAGLVTPGVPRSRLRGGAWDGLPVVSKSGGFGPDALWRDLLAGNGHFFGSIDA
ncbi:Hrp-dependent type III effector protein [Dankookia rubra]|uniref:Hrp-dependent type III effector protein n=1 Tax=Dankookia rubra TaxID=1442381 RepID=A0A4R5QF05_9PROT|nr:four-carbon acid sugar kinase family protein [Dankookia rubra]TDH61101.1 Hrp-dependent type III effector protein [Dankookia rubra]